MWDFFVFGPLSFFLTEDHREELSNLLLENDIGNILKYIIPGVAKTKSIYMNDKLARLMADFATTNNISQREIVETRELGIDII